MATGTGWDLTIGVGLNDKFSKGMTNIYKSMAGIGANTQLSRSMHQYMTQGLDMVSNAGAKTLGLIKDSFNAYAEFETLIKNAGVIGNITGRELDKLREKARKIGLETIFSPQESAKMFETMSKAGLKAQEQINLSEPVAYLAAATGETLESTVSRVNDIMAGFGINSNRTMEVVDKIAATVNGANLTFDHLFNTMRYGSYSAKIAGISMEELFAATGALSNAGLKGSIAGTTLNNFLIQLTNAVSQYRTMRQGQALEDLGLSPDEVLDSTGKLKNLMDIFDILNKKVELGNANAVSAVNALFGRRGGRTLLAVKKDAESLGRSYREIYNLINSQDTVGYAKKVADVRQWETPMGRIEALKSAWEELKISIGSNLAAPLTKGLIILWKITGWISKFTDTKLGKFTTYLTAISGLLMLVIGRLGRLAASILYIQALSQSQMGIGFGGMMGIFSGGSKGNGARGTAAAGGRRVFVSPAGWSTHYNPNTDRTTFRGPNGRFASQQDFMAAGGRDITPKPNAGRTVFLGQIGKPLRSGIGAITKIGSKILKPLNFIMRGVGWIGKGLVRAIPVLGWIITAVSILGFIWSWIKDKFHIGEDKSKDEETTKDSTNTPTFRYGEDPEVNRALRKFIDPEIIKKKAESDTSDYRELSNSIQQMYEQNHPSDLSMSKQAPAHITINVDGYKSLDEEIYGSVSRNINV